MHRTSAVLAIVLAIGSLCAMASDEGTRHIVGDDVDMFFMNDKVFGTVAGHPLWANYDCGTNIKGEMDVDGAYQTFAFEYHSDGDRKVTGAFGDREVSLGKVEKSEGGFIYHVYVGQEEHVFSIRFEKLAYGHMLNSIIEGSLGEGRDIKLVVDGKLCPFATTGIILIAVGSTLAA